MQSIRKIQAADGLKISNDDIKNESRSIFIFDPFTDKLAKETIEKLIELETKDPEKDIKLFINSPGGEVLALFSIMDSLNLVRPDICTYCIGEAASAASIILMCGTKGKRYITKNSRVLLHQVSTGTWGHISDVKISTKESDRLNKSLMNIIVQKTKIKKLDLSKLIERDCWLTATQALRYGVVDKIL